MSKETSFAERVPKRSPSDCRFWTSKDFGEEIFVLGSDHRTFGVLLLGVDWREAPFGSGVRNVRVVGLKI